MTPTFGLRWCGMRLKLTILAIMLPVAALASGKVFYGSRAGMTVTVVSMSGLDTERAVIRTKHTRDDAVGFCRDYVQKITKRCVDDEMAIPLNDEVTGNCKTGDFVDFGGHRYRFEGKPRKKDDNMTALYVIRDLSSGEIADGSSASGYPTNSSIYKALCPATAPFDIND